jgi:hypothetical protein
MMIVSNFNLTPGIALPELEDKFFTTGSSSGGGNTELYSTGGATPGLPNWRDIHQANVGDCYFLSSAAALTQHDPRAILKIIRDNGNGTYTVTFQIHKDSIVFPTLMPYSSVQVTVNSSDIFNETQYIGGTDPANGKKVIWPQVLQAAFAKVSEPHSGIILASPSFLGGGGIGGGYAAIGKGGYPKDALQLLTGQNASSWNPNSNAGAQELAQLPAQFAAGKPIVVSTPPASKSPKAGVENGKNPATNNLVADHSYAVVDSYTIAGIPFVLLNNPWGSDQPFAIPVKALGSVSDLITVGSSVAPAAPPRTGGHFEVPRIDGPPGFI